MTPKKLKVIAFNYLCIIFEKYYFLLFNFSLEVFHVLYLTIEHYYLKKKEKKENIFSLEVDSTEFSPSSVMFKINCQMPHFNFSVTAAKDLNFKINILNSTRL